MSKQNTNTDVLDLKNELSSLQKEIEGVMKKAESTEDKATLGEIMDLKRRVDLMEKEFKKLSEALKNTLVDVRSLVTELDNPFNILRSIGVDKLLEKVMERAEEEISKAKKEELSKRVAKKALGENEKDKKPPLIVGISPSPTGTILTSSPKESRTITKVEKAQSAEAVSKNKQDISHLKVEKHDEAGKEEAKREVGRISHTIISQKPIASTFSSSFPEYKLQKSIQYKRSESPQNNLTSLKVDDLPRVFLVASYLLTNLGINNAISLLSEYVSRNWISTETMSSIVNVMNMLVSYSPELKSYENNSTSLSFEDHIFIISLLKALEDPNNDRDLIFMLLLSKLLPIKLPFQNV